jgi:hypothetical protein
LIRLCVLTLRRRSTSRPKLNRPKVIWCEAYRKSLDWYRRPVWNEVYFQFLHILQQWNVLNYYKTKVIYLSWINFLKNHCVRVRLGNWICRRSFLHFKGASKNNANGKDWQLHSYLLIVYSELIIKFLHPNLKKINQMKWYRRSEWPIHNVENSCFWQANIIMDARQFISSVPIDGRTYATYSTSHQKSLGRPQIQLANLPWV